MKPHPIWMLCAMLSMPTAHAAEAPPSVFRCGSTYQATPCPLGHEIVVDDARTDAQHAASLQVTREQSALGRAMESDRLRRENQERSGARGAARLDAAVITHPVPALKTAKLHHPKLHKPTRVAAAASHTSGVVQSRRR